MKLTFRGGVHPPMFKEKTCEKSIKVFPLPKTAVIPLIQHTGAPCEPLVKVGDEVKTGQMIGKSDSFVSAPVHATITGKVTAVASMPHPTLGEAMAVVVDKAEAEEVVWSSQKADWQKMEPAEITGKVRDAGLVGMGGAAFPTHVKLSPPAGRKFDTLIINGAECEPYLTADQRLMVEEAPVILEGAMILLKASGASRCIIAIEDNKPDAIKAINRAINENKEFKAETAVLKAKYPQGAEKQLIKVLLNREVPSGGLPVDVGALVQNVGTCLAVYEAVCFGKPFIERVMTVAGTPVKEPGNFKVRIGTPLADLVSAVGLKEKSEKMIMGGPMMGIALYTQDVPMIKGTTALILLTVSEARVYEPRNCIRCGFCVEACPMNLIPSYLGQYAKKGKYKEAKDELSLMDCTECGCCAYECPSKIPIVHWVKLAKYKARNSK